jgi:putative restriction endonuclease
MSLLNDYINLFSHLRTDVNHKRWPFTTRYQAPHKPFLLLAILDLFAQGSLSTNFIEISPDLGDLFARYWRIVMPIDRHGNMALPFFHLRSSGFWHLIPVSGNEVILEETRRVDTLSQLKKLILGAKLDDGLFNLIKQEDPRNALRTILIKTYFDLSFEPLLLEQCALNIKAYLYSQALIANVLHGVKENPPELDQSQTNFRDQGFRRTVVQVYNHRCAFCGVRMLTADGHTAVDAAHIVPWSISHNDDPRNGMALCGLCHWTFDEGLASVSSRYSLLFSSELRSSENVAGHLLTLQGRPIIGPEDSAFMPDSECLSWHRQKKYRTT